MSFDRAADVYERSRPSYPAAAVDWLLPPEARTVLDLGAGTGKLTRELVARGLDCIAVDPSPKMLAQLTSVSPQVRALEGTGESIPLPDDSVDVVIAAQAWHWMDPDVAAVEVARVLRPGGRLGLVWNVRDDREPWIAKLGEIINHGQSGELLEHPPRVGSQFGELESTVIDWSMQLSRQQLHELIASRSFLHHTTAGGAAVGACNRRPVARHRARDIRSRAIDCAVSHVVLPHDRACQRNRVNHRRLG